MSVLQAYQTDLIEHGMKVGALKFGTFTLKSGRSVCLCFDLHRARQPDCLSQDLALLLQRRPYR